jgi:hypothetical protein
MRSLKEQPEQSYVGLLKSIRCVRRRSADSEVRRRGSLGLMVLQGNSEEEI